MKLSLAILHAYAEGAVTPSHAWSALGETVSRKRVSTAVSNLCRGGKLRKVGELRVHGHDGGKGWRAGEQELTPRGRAALARSRARERGAR